MLAVEGKRQEAIETMDEETLKFGAAAFPSTFNVAEFDAVMGERPRPWSARTGGPQRRRTHGVVSGAYGW